MTLEVDLIFTNFKFAWVAVKVRPTLAFPVQSVVTTSSTTVLGMLLQHFDSKVGGRSMAGLHAFRPGIDKTLKTLIRQY